MGWEVILWTPSQDLIFTLVWRAYIPPTMDTFVDFLVESEFGIEQKN